MNRSSQYFFNRAFELLHRKSFDSYRLSLNNPRTVFAELDSVIEKYTKKKIKHFDPTISEVGSEALDFLQNPYLSDLLRVDPFTKNQVIHLLNETCVKSKSDKKTRSLKLLSKTILTNNPDFKLGLFNRVVALVNTDDPQRHPELDTLTGWLLSELIDMGFSRAFIVDRFRKCRDNIFNGGTDFQIAVGKLNTIFDTPSQDYRVVFKVKKQTTQTLRFTTPNIKAIPKLLKAIEDSTLLSQKFKDRAADEVFIQVVVKVHDFWSALTLGYQQLSGELEINALHNSDNRIIVENQAIVIHKASKLFRVDTIEQQVDGFYYHNEVEFTRFTNNLKNIESNTAREKISSAIRFYKLGNESVEMEHKILNYWIGFEQLFSAVDSNEDAINRMKSFYTSINIAYYFQRRVNYLLSSLDRNTIRYDGNKIDASIFESTLDTTKLSGTNPLYLSRLESYFKLNNNKELKKYIELHSKRLNQHLTRIYRVRNELVHEGRTRTNTKLLAGHLRHYLLFTIEQVTNEISENPTLDKMDDVFVYFENLKERMKSCENLNQIIALKNYNGYME